MDSFLQISHQTAPPLVVNACTLTLHSQVVRLAWPGRAGGLIWQRPTALTVQTPDGRIETQPVRDVTRHAQIFILFTALAGVLLLWARQRRVAHSKGSPHV